MDLNFEGLRRPNEMTCDLTTSQSAVLNYIDTTFSDTLNEIHKRPRGDPKIILKQITALRPHYDTSENRIQWHIEDREAVYRFPGKNKDEAWRFTCIGKILSEIQEAVLSGVPITKRDIFYRDPVLFKRQATVDRYIDDIAHTCQVTRADLNVNASAKGLVAGLHGPRTDASEPFQLIPESLNKIDTLALYQIKWILIVEKEASFKSLVEKLLQQSSAIGSGILVTGKGYPDLATRRFLRNLLDHPALSNAPPLAFGFFDCDPDGINIFQNYRFGSKNLAQENLSNVPEMKWLGLRLEEEFLGTSDDRVIIELTKRDREKAKAMLKNSLVAEGEVSLLNDESRSTLLHMLMLNRKMEMQVLEDREGGTAAWVERALISRMNA